MASTGSAVTTQACWMPTAQSALSLRRSVQMDTRVQALSLGTGSRFGFGFRVGLDYGSVRVRGSHWLWLAGGWAPRVRVNARARVN